MDVVFLNQLKIIFLFMGQLNPITRLRLFDNFNFIVSFNNYSVHYIVFIYSNWSVFLSHYII